MKKPVQSRVLLQRQRLCQGAQELSLSDFEHNPDQALYMDHIRSQDTLGAQELQSTLDQRKRAIALHRIGEQCPGHQQILTPAAGTEPTFSPEFIQVLIQR